MAGIEIPGLYRKFRLLIAYGHAKDWDELAFRFGAKASTLKWWGNGSDVRAPDQLPSKHLEALLDIIGDALAPETAPDTVQSIAFGSAADFEEALRRRDPGLLEALLDAEADRENIHLFLKSGSAGLVETEEEAAMGSNLVVPLDAWFRIECTAPRAVRHAIVLQNAQKIWGTVPLATSENRRRIFIPGYGPDGSPAFMRERSLAGINRFIVFQTHAPPPPAIMDHLKAGVALDYTALSSLIDFYSAQRTDQRHLFLLELTIGERA